MDINDAMDDESMLPAPPRPHGGGGGSGGPRYTQGRHRMRYDPLATGEVSRKRRRGGGGGGGAGGDDDFVDDDDDAEEYDDEGYRPARDMRRLFADTPPPPAPEVTVQQFNVPGSGDDEDADEDEEPSNTSIDGLATRTTIRRGGAAAGAAAAAEFRSLAELADMHSQRALADARVKLSRAHARQHLSSSRGAICYLCRYGHRGVDAATGAGAQLHGMLLRFISQNHATLGAEETTAFAERYFNEQIKPAFERAGLNVPVFEAAEVLVHLSTIAHSKNNRLFLGWVIDRLRMHVEVLDAEAAEPDRGCNVAKLRESRMTMRDMLVVYRTDPRQLVYGEPTPADIQPDLTSRTTRASILAGTDASHLPSFLFDGEDDED